MRKSMKTLRTMFENEDRIFEIARRARAEHLTSSEAYELLASQVEESTDYKNLPDYAQLSVLAYEKGLWRFFESTLIEYRDRDDPLNGLYYVGSDDPYRLPNADES